MAATVSCRCPRSASRVQCSLSPAGTYCSVESLVQRCAELRADLRGTRAAMKRARQRQRQHTAAWALDEQTRNVAVILYIITGYDAEPAVFFLERCGARLRWPTRSARDLTAAVEGLFLCTGLEEMVALLDAASPLDKRSLITATRWALEWAVVAWARRLNIERGIAPSTELLLCHAEACRSEIPEPVRPRAIGAIGDHRARQWAYRLRARWSGRIGAIPAIEAIGCDEIRSKVLTIHILQGRQLCWRVYYFGQCVALRLQRARRARVS